MVPSNQAGRLDGENNMTYDTDFAMRNRTGINGANSLPKKPVIRNQTVTQIIADHDKQIADLKALAKKFPDAYLKDGEWISPKVTAENAKNFATNYCGELVTCHFYVTVKAKGGVIRVWGEKTYDMTMEHVVKVMEDNPQMVIKTLEKVFLCQD